jgi:Flp pilus assembly pilin Flp
MRQPRHQDRGATLVEYAMVVSLVVVVLIGGITKITDSGDEKLEASGERVGTSEDNSYYAGTSSTSSTTPASSTTTTSLPGQQIQPSNITATPPPSSSSGNRWVANATVTVTLTTSPFTGIAGLVVTGRWTDGSGPDEEQTCTTSASGTCIVQFTDIQDIRPSATFTIDSISGPGFFWTAGGAGDVTSLVVGCSPPLDASCD